MGSIRIGVGTEWLYEDGRTYRAIRQPSEDQLIAVDVKFQVEREFSRSDILSKYAKEQLVFAPTPGNSTPPATSPRQHDMRDLNEAEQSLIRQRWAALEPLTQLGRRPVDRDFRARAAQLAMDEISVSSSTLRRYWKRWERSGENRLALLPAKHRCGAPGRPRHHGMFQRYPLLGRLLEDAIRDVYLTMARRPISAVVRRVLEDLQRNNARLPVGQALPLPKTSALARAVTRRISQMDSWELDRRRWGKKIADRKHQGISPQRLATRILQRVEVDHTPLKILVGTDAGPMGQPWLTVLVDYFSRMVVGFCVGFEPPSYAVLMEALRHAILPKAYVSSLYPKVRSKWPCYGVPETLVCDRVADFISNDLEAAAFQLGITLHFNAPRKPHLKGTVEAFFGGLNDQLIASLPGRTFRSWERRADYKPEDGPLITYGALQEIIHLYVVDVYAVDKHPTLPVTRLSAWQASALEYPPCLPATADHLLILLAKQAQRDLTRHGIELGGMFYTSPELMALRATLAANNVDTSGLTVRYNPWDLGSIWVLDPSSGACVKAGAVDSTLQGMTEHQWQILKRAVRHQFDSPQHILTLAEGRNSIRAVVEATVKKPSRKRRRRAARFLQQAPSEAQETALKEDAWTEVTVDGRVHFTGDALREPITNRNADMDEAISEHPAVAAAIHSEGIDVEDWGVASSSRP